MSGSLPAELEEHVRGLVEGCRRWVKMLDAEPEPPAANVLALAVFEAMLRVYGAALIAICGRAARDLLEDAGWMDFLAAGYFARRIPWRIHGRDVRDAVAARIAAEGMSRSAVKHRELAAAVILAFEECARPQRHRFGRVGRTAAFVPDDLIPAGDVGRFLAWLEDEAVKAAEASLLNEPYPPTGKDALSGRGSAAPPTVAEPLAGMADDPLLLLLEQESSREAAARLHALLERASPRQRELVSLLTENETVAGAAHRMGITSATAYVLLYRLRRAV